MMLERENIELLELSLSQFGDIDIDIVIDVLGGPSPHNIPYTERRMNYIMMKMI